MKILAQLRPPLCNFISLFIRLLVPHFVLFTLCATRFSTSVYCLSSLRHHNSPSICHLFNLSGFIALQLLHSSAFSFFDFVDVFLFTCYLFLNVSMSISVNSRSIKPSLSVHLMLTTSSVNLRLIYSRELNGSDCLHVW